MRAETINQKTSTIHYLSFHHLLSLFFKRVHCCVRPSEEDVSHCADRRDPEGVGRVVGALCSLRAAGRMRR